MYSFGYNSQIKRFQTHVDKDVKLMPKDHLHFQLDSV
jgi:hypothetical protein